MASIIVRLDMVQTLALAAVLLFVGYGIRRRTGVLDRYNIPAPVIGGFVFAAVALVLRLQGVLAFEFDTTLQTPLMVAFFTTIGLGASLGLLRIGGPQVLLFWGLASLLAVLQNAVGVALAAGMGVHPFLGLIAGSITMTGGHGTGAAFGRLMEDQYAFTGGVTAAMAAATFGLVSGGLIGGPVATTLIKRNRLALPGGGAPSPMTAQEAEALGLDSEIDTELGGEPATAYTLLKVITIVLVAMWAGSVLSHWLGQRFTLPAYIGAMIAAAILRNAADVSGVLKFEQRVVDDLGTIALSLFLAMALMSLKLWELLDLAVPMLAILCAQVTMMGAFAYVVTYRVMGRDYDAAVMAGGHCGFGLGATPNAVANMEALVERFGAAPRAFLVVPMVGAFFIDFTNALIITAFINLVR
jgi:ESS family glutamate:Na+ symporter